MLQVLTPGGQIPGVSRMEDWTWKVPELCCGERPTLRAPRHGALPQHMGARGHAFPATEFSLCVCADLRGQSGSSDGPGSLNENVPKPQSWWSLP